jgi:hypothetical protein
VPLPKPHCGSHVGRWPSRTRCARRRRRSRSLTASARRARFQQALAKAQTARGGEERYARPCITSQFWRSGQSRNRTTQQGMVYHALHADSGSELPVLFMEGLGDEIADATRICPCPGPRRPRVGADRLVLPHLPPADPRGTARTARPRARPGQYASPLEHGPAAASCRAAQHQVLRRVLSASRGIASLRYAPRWRQLVWHNPLVVAVAQQTSSRAGRSCRLGTSSWSSTPIPACLADVRAFGSRAVRPGTCCRNRSRRYACRVSAET